jgi:hypothetical protein
MPTLARSAYLDSQFGVDEELPHAGSTLENPYVFDATARELRAMAEQGLVCIVSEHIVRTNGDVLIDRIRFRRLR